MLHDLCLAPRCDRIYDTQCMTNLHNRVRRRAMRGRPKDRRIDADVVAAVLNLLKTEGYRHITIERIARTVKRARTSLYSRWPSKRHLVAYAVVSTLDADPAPDSGSLRQDLICAVDTLRRAFSGPLRQALPGLLADMAHDQELARVIREEVLIRRRTSIKNAISRGIARGEIRGRHTCRCVDRPADSALLFSSAIRSCAHHPSLHRDGGRLHLARRRVLRMNTSYKLISYDIFIDFTSIEITAAQS